MWAWLARRPEIVALQANARFGGPSSVRVGWALLVEDEELPTTSRVLVDGIAVRYEESDFAVRIVVEGPLASVKVSVLIEDARSKFERRERTPYVARRVT